MIWLGKQKGPRKTRAFLFCDALQHCFLGVDRVNRAAIYASAAVDACVGVDYTLVALLADCVNRTGILTCTTVGAVVGNCVCHDFTSL